MNKNGIFKISFAIFLSGISYSLLASGFRLPESSIDGMSLSNAIVANHKESGALIYNPAIMAKQESSRLVNAGVINISLDAEVNPDVGNPADSQGDGSVQIPSFFYMRKLNQWAWGLGLHAPFGLETNWPDNTFGGFAGVDALEPETSKLEVINLTPNIAYLIDNNNSVAFGINYYQVLDLVFNTHAIKINADGNEFGYTLAYHFDDGPWSFGATYRSSVDTHVKGDITAGPLTADAEADIEFPKMVQLGIRNQINNDLSIEFDIDRTYWSSFSRVDIKHSHPGVSLNPIPSTNNWKDVNAYRLGLSYQLSGATRLRFGYTIDKTPQPDRYYSARIPDADRQLLGAGFTYQGGQDWQFEGGLMLVMFDDRRIQNTTGYTPGVDPEANGTTAYNGKYKSDALLIGFGFSKNFNQ